MKNDIQEIAKLSSFQKTFLEKIGVEESMAYQIRLAVEEIEVYNGGMLAPEEMSLQELALAETEMRQTPAFEADKQWYAQNFDCGNTFVRTKNRRAP